MRIMSMVRDYVIMDLPGGHSLHIYEKEGGFKLYLNDHFHLNVEGTHKKVPTVILDSDEYSTRLKVIETEHKWEK